MFYIKEMDAVFLHLPKCGGTSIRSGTYEKPKHRPVVHATDIPKSWPLNRVFTFVRHPLERFASAVKYIRRHEHQKMSDMTYERAFEILVDTSIPHQNARNQKMWWFKHHLIAMTHPDNYLSLARHVGRFENLQDDWKRIHESLCPNKTVPDLPHLNGSGKLTNWKHDIPAEIISNLASYHRRDFTELGYSLP